MDKPNSQLSLAMTNSWLQWNYLINNPTWAEKKVSTLGYSWKQFWQGLPKIWSSVTKKWVRMVQCSPKQLEGKECERMAAPNHNSLKSPPVHIALKERAKFLCICFRLLGRKDPCSHWTSRFWYTLWVLNILPVGELENFAKKCPVQLWKWKWRCKFAFTVSFVFTFT